MLLDKQGKVCSDTVRCTHVYNSNSDVYIWQQNLFETPVYSYIDKKGNWLTDLNHDGSISFFEETFNDDENIDDEIGNAAVNEWLFNADTIDLVLNKLMDKLSQNIFSFVKMANFKYQYKIYNIQYILEL